MKAIFIIYFTSFVAFLSNAQPCTKVKELNRKRHKIDGSTYGHPYTTFDKHNGLTFQETIENIRAKIKYEYHPTNPGPIYSAYKLVYENASSTRPSDNGMSNEGVSALAQWAKNNAFVFLIGLNAQGLKIDSLDTTFATRNAFRDNARIAFDYLTGEIDANNPGWGWWYSPVLYFGANLIEEEKFLKNIKFHSRSLILWLQAYDLLKAAYELPELRNAGRNPWGFANADRNGLNCSPRQKLRKLTRDLYYYSEGGLGIVEHNWGWKKNHGIAAASALLMAAQVLNDAGVETDFFNTWYSYIPVIGWAIRTIAEPWPHPKYSPINWNKIGQNGINENLFEGKHIYPAINVPQANKNSSPNGYSSYAEGPVYAEYGLLDCGIPAMRTQQNFYPNWTDEPFLKRNEINNIFNWLDAITVDNTLLPTYDNSRPDNHSTKLALTNNEGFNYGIITGLNAFYADYVAFIGGNNIKPNKNIKDEIKYLPETGNIIVRNKTDNAEFYFHALAETDISNDRPAYTDILGFSDGTHEEYEAGSFMLMTKEVHLFN